MPVLAELAVDSSWIAPTAVTAIALATMFVMAWQLRARAVKRWLALWDVYAERELAQQQRDRARKMAQPTSTATMSTNPSVLSTAIERR
jgi:hypothetical protein